MSDDTAGRVLEGWVVLIVLFIVGLIGVIVWEWAQHTDVSAAVWEGVLTLGFVLAALVIAGVVGTAIAYPIGWLIEKVPAAYERWTDSDG